MKKKYKCVSCGESLPERVITDAFGRIGLCCSDKCFYKEWGMALEKERVLIEALKKDLGISFYRGSQCR